MLNGEVTVWCPFASTSALLVRVCHEEVGATFDGATDREIATIAIAARDALVAVGRVIDHPPYNLVVHTAPRWYVEITPRLGVLAGFEQATGVFVNTIPPERAVGFLQGHRMSVTVTVCTTIDAPPVVVWAAVENIESHTAWMKDAVRITFKSEQHSGVGAEFECLTRVGPLFTTDKFVVTQWRPGELMGIEHRGAVTGDAEFRLEPDGDAIARASAGRSGSGSRGGSAGSSASGSGARCSHHLWSGNVARLKASIEDAR